MALRHAVVLMALAGCSHDWTVPTRALTSFRDGQFPDASYAGTRDTYISELVPDKNQNQDDFCRIRVDFPEGEDHSCLIRWDVSGIAPGSRVESAQIVVYVTSGSDGPLLYEAKQSWDENVVSWLMRTFDQAWSQPGALGPDDRGEAVGALRAATVNTTTVVDFEPAALALVQRWVDDPSSNHGLIVSGTSSFDALVFTSREGTVVEQRPQLNIAYLPP